MKSIITPFISLLFLLVISSQFTIAQCPVTAYASKTNISCGDPVTLSAVASGCIPLNNNFNGGSIGTWQATTGAVVTNGNGSPNASYNCVGAPPEGPNCLWMGATVGGERNVTTQDYNLTNCGGGSTTSGSLCFWMKYSTQGGPDPCEGIDLAAEGITVQYSTNGGGTWTTMQYYNPNGGFDPGLTSWNYYCLAIPTVAIGPNTRFRWLQSENSGAGFDTWGLDDVSIILNGPGYTFDWAHDGQAPSATSITPDIQPISNTTYTVTYTNGVQTCSSSVTVNVIKPTTDATIDKTLVCEGSPVNLNATTTLSAAPPTSCGVTTLNCDPISTVAAEVTVGTGAVTSQTGNSGFGYLGASNYNGMIRAQFLFRASNLIASGLKAGKITGLQFDVASNSLGSKTYESFEVKMKCTSNNELDEANGTFENMPASSVVFTSSNYTVTTGWVNLFLQSGFNWDGVSNIVINICWRSGIGSGQNHTIVTRHTNVNYFATSTVGTNQSGATINCNDDLLPGAFDYYQTLPNLKFGQCVARNAALTYNWTSIPSGFTSNIQNPTANPTNNPTRYIVSLNEAGRPAGCAVTDTVLVNTYKPVLTVNPNPANICPPGTTSANLVTTATTNTTNTVQRTFSNSTPVAVPESTAGLGQTCVTTGTAITSTINVTGITPATLAANPLFQVAVNMTTNIAREN